MINSGPADQEVVMDGTYRQMKVSESRELENLESHLATLATVGSISPYIGLFGTVWGIMHAFIALAAVKNATLSMVAPPIAEALIATAMGLFAAIPAVMFYNRFVTKVETLENRYINFMDEFATILNRRLVRVRSEMNQKKDNVQNTSSTMQTSMQSSMHQAPSYHSQSTTGYVREPQKPFSHTTAGGEDQQTAFARARLNRAAHTQSSVRYQTPGVEGDRMRNFSRPQSNGQER